MKTVSIIGCGWFGMPLAQAFLEKGLSVKGTTTTPDKIPDMQQLGIGAHLYELGNPLPPEVVSGADLALVNIPPGTRADHFGYLKNISDLRDDIIRAGVKKAIYIGTTSVYDDLQGHVRNDAPPDPQNASDNLLLACERMWHDRTEFDWLVIRFGGLIGKQRHPANLLSRRQNLPNPTAPVNLIGLEDCIGATFFAIDNNLWNRAINAVAPTHPTREAFYTKACQELKIPVPHFGPPVSKTYKIIEADTLRAHGYEFQRLFY